MYTYVYSNWKYSWKHLIKGTHKKYIFCTCMKSFVHFVQTNIYKSIWNTYEIRIFITMGAGLEASTKYILSDLSKCCYPKWQVSLFKTTLQRKTKKVTLKNNKEVATGALKIIFSNLITCLLSERTVLNCRSTEIQNNIFKNRIGLLIFCRKFGHGTYFQLLLALIKLPFSAKSKLSANFSLAFWTKSFSLKTLSLFLQAFLLHVNLTSPFLSIKQRFKSSYSSFYFLTFLSFPLVKHF